MLPFRARGQRGITLIEIMLYCAIIAAAAAAIFVFSKKASVAAAVETEQRQIESIVKTVESLFATQPNFAALGTNGATYLRDRASRSGLKLTTDAAGAAILGTGIGDGLLNLAVWDVVPETGPAVPNSGYRLAYQGLAAGECTRFVTATYPIAYQVGVAHDGLNDASATTLARRGQLAVGRERVAELCAESTPSVFLYFDPARAIAASTPPTPPPAARCAPVHETQQTSCPAGQTGTITQERDGTCTGPGNTMVYTVWVTTDNTCQNPPVAPPTVTPPSTPDDCTLITATRVQACPLGQLGQVVQQSQRDSCAGTSTPWVTISTTCQSPPPPSTCTPSTQTQTIACPAGQGGQMVQTRSSTCLNSTAVPTWSSWNTVSNTCTSACSQGGGNCCVVQRQTQTTSDPCPAGTYGASGQDQERFLGCVNAQTQASSWGAWQTLTTTGSCTACPGTSTETNLHWVARQDACPVGQTGTIDYEIEQVQTRTISYSCPAGTTALPAPNTSAWSGWADTGASRNLVNNCTTAPPSAMGYRWKMLMPGNGHFFNYGGNSWPPQHPYTPAPPHPAVFHTPPSAALLSAVRSAEAKPLSTWRNNPTFAAMGGEIVQYRTTSASDAWPGWGGGQNRHNNSVSCSSANVGEVLMTQEAGSCYSNLMGGCANDTFSVTQLYFECVYEEMPTPTGGWLLKDANAFVPGTCAGSPYVHIVGPGYDQTFTGTATYMPLDPITGMGLNDIDTNIMGVDGTPGPHPLYCDDSRRGWEVTVEKRCMTMDLTGRRNGTTTYVCNGSKTALENQYQMFAYVSDTTASASCNGSTSYTRVQYTGNPNGSLDLTSGPLLKSSTMFPTPTLGDYTVGGVGGGGFWWNDPLPAITSSRADKEWFDIQVGMFNENITVCNRNSIGTRKITTTCDDNSLTTVTHECQSFSYGPGSVGMGVGTYNNPQPGYSQN